MCTRDKAISLSYNIKQIENWINEYLIIDNNLLNSFDMLKQASDLFFMRKSEWDYDELSKCLSKLNLLQIKHFLTMYKPVEYYEKEIKQNFIEKLLDKVKEKKKDDQLLLTIDIKNEINLELKYKTSVINLDSIEIPDEFGLQFLIKF